MQRATSISSSGAMFGTYVRIGSGSCRVTARTSATVLFALNACRPVSISYRTMPNEKMSVADVDLARSRLLRRPVARRSEDLAGRSYRSTCAPRCAAWRAAASRFSCRASPKSRTFAWSTFGEGVVMNTFSGLMSRCVTPDACARASARATSRAMPSASDGREPLRARAACGATGPRAAPSRCRDAPRTRRPRRPSRCWDASASRRAAPRGGNASGSPTSHPRASSTFSATWRSSFSSTAS